MANGKTLEGKVAIVTGARQGIGRAEAVALAAEGAIVLACDLVEEMDELKAEVKQVGGTCVTLKCDVGNKSDIQAVVEAAIDRFGRIDILVNNAQAGLEAVPWDELTDEIVDLSLQTGPVASWRFMQACFPYMKKQRWGRIINTASGASRGGVADMGHYAMAKGAIASLSYAAATDWSKHGITVNVIYPAILTQSLKAWMDSDPDHKAVLEADVPVGFIGEANRDLAPIIVFLASEASRYLTGHPFCIDGGSSNAPR